MIDLANQSDEALVEMVRSQDQELYAELVGRYQTKLLRYAGYLLRNETAAADVVQEAFIKAFVNLNGFDLKKKFSSWIYRIVHNEAVNYLKKHRREVPLTEPMSNHFASDLPRPEEAFATDDARRLLWECLMESPEKYRAPLTLFYFEGKSYAEIAEILRLPVGTVGTYISRGKKMLRDLCLAKGAEVYV